MRASPGVVMLARQINARMQPLSPHLSSGSWHRHKLEAPLRRSNAFSSPFTSSRLVCISQLTKQILGPGIEDG